MECHMEQVLNRDQRTTKTRYFEASKPHEQQPCLSCQNTYQKPPSSTEKSQFHLYSTTSHSQSFPNFDAFSIEGGASRSSLNNCHNQYFSKFKRLLLRTDNECGCEDASFPRISEKRKRGVATWFKKLQNVLLLSTYLSLLTLPNTYAQPTKMCNRSSDAGFWENPCDWSNVPTIVGEPLKEMNVSSIKVAINSAKSALNSAIYFKERFRNQKVDTGSDWLASLDTIPNYSWLPNLTKFSSEEEFHQYLDSLKGHDILLDLFKILQNISVPLEQVIKDYNQDPYEPLGGNFSQMEGRIKNVLCEIYEGIIDNNIKVGQHVKRDIMPVELREACNDQTMRTTRDWVVLRELVNILEYTVAVCQYLLKTRKA